MLARLDHFVVTSGATGEQRIAGRLFCYCALERERLASVTPETPLLGIVLRGTKEVWTGTFNEVLPAGTVFALPGGAPVDVVNIPDARGLYESLILSIENLPAPIQPIAGPRRIERLAIRLTAELVETLVHTAAAIGNNHAAVGKVRLTELLMLLAEDSAGQILLAGDIAQRAQWLIAAQPDAHWTVAQLARELGMGASSLRRALDRLGRPFRKILAEARMQAARRTLADGASVTEAAVAAGYASRSHFTRAYRQAFGATPGADARVIRRAELRSGV
ncbi:helix-turn-helix transcriptional regulator [Paracoccus suum]|uniref:helix-turn-helix transcriptional regulator n=1 Tax=Paracoccus suum TaxID=2259340 RepID=UPI0013B061DD|nr:AraC family transcriptional regulator [Paracoccus suum]